jgi:hypothetical protein
MRKKTALGVNERPARGTPHHGISQPTHAGFRPEPRSVQSNGADRCGSRPYFRRPRSAHRARSSTLSRSLQVLEASGVIAISATDRDARRRTVRLTDKGARSLEAGIVGWKQAHGELAKRIDPEAARRLAFAAEALEEN